MKEKDLHKYDSERITIDWSAKCVGGYPIYPYSEETIELLRETLTEHGILTPEIIIDRIRNRPITYKATSDSTLISEKVFDSTTVPVTDLHYVFNEVKDDYGKMLSVLYYFDPNALGTLSEVLLSELIKTVPNTSVNHTGGSQGLSDIQINGKEISVKTTEAGLAINLGSHEKLFGKHENNAIVSELSAAMMHNKKMLISELKTTDKISDKCKDSILRRLQAIKEKMTGPDENHHFVWIEKKYQKGQVLRQLSIYILNLDSKKIDEIFDQSEIHLTEKGWGLIQNNMHIVTADSIGKPLNIHPNFIKASCIEEEIITIDVPIETTQSKAEIKAVVTDMMLSAFKNISDTLYKK